MSITDAPQCTATSKRSGERCKAAAMRGQRVCKLHGGKSPQALAKAEQRQALDQAQREATSILGVAGTDQDPLEHALEAMYRAKWMETALSLVLERRASRDGEISHGGLTTTDMKGTTTADPLLVELRHWTTLRTQISTSLMRAGIAERHVRISERQLEQMVQRVRGFVAELGLSLDDPQIIRLLQRWFSGEMPSMPAIETTAIAA